MFRTDLTLPIMIVLGGIALTSSAFPADNTRENRVLVLVEMWDSQQPQEYTSCTLCKSTNVRHKNKIRRYLEPVIIKSENVLGKYEQRKEELTEFYPWFQELSLADYQPPSEFGCLNFKLIKKRISELTHKVRQILKNLQLLINLEKSPKVKKHDSNEGRLKLLKEFRAEIKNLIVELEHDRRLRHRKPQRRNKSLRRETAKKSTSANLSNFKSQTQLKYKERKVLENLKMLLENSTRNFKFSVCL